MTDDMMNLRALMEKSADTDFKSSRTVGAHFGLTPRRFQSGEKDNPGRISHAGDADMRATRYATANAMLMRSIAWSSLKAWGVRLMKTKGRRRAIVAWPARLLLCSTACGPTALTSGGDHRRRRHDLTAPPQF